MVVGILSDTHGRVEGTVQALRALREGKAEFYVHCGDVGGEAILDLMAGLPLAFVWGNTDWDRGALGMYARGVGLQCHEDWADLELGGRRVAVTHGDQTKVIKQIVGGGKHSIILHGHTHVARDQVIEGVRWINPGAVHRAARPSVAVWDTACDEVRFILL